MMIILSFIAAVFISFILGFFTAALLAASKND